MANAGSVTESWQDSIDRVNRPIRTVTLQWTSTAGGAVIWLLAGGRNGGYMSGKIQRVVFIPGSGGAQPSASYSVTLTDSSGIDVLAGQGASLSNSSTTHVKPGVPIKDGTTTSTAEIAVDDVCTLNVTAAGVSKSGTVVVYLGEV